MTRHAVEPVGIEDGIDVEVEAVADDDDEPIVPVCPVDEFEESGPKAEGLEGEVPECRFVGFDEVERGSVVLLDGELASMELRFEFLPSGCSETLEELAGGIVEGDGVIEIEADDVCHAFSFARRTPAGSAVRLERARYLAGQAAQAALEAMPVALEEEGPVRLAERLRRAFSPEEAAALGEQLTLRGRARRRFGELPVSLLTAEGLEMMTHPLVARRRAARLAALGRHVVDLTCGLGGDLVALLQTGREAFGVERDAATALLAGANTGGRAVRGDALRPPARLEGFAVVLDPSRRQEGVRRFDPAAFSPPWEACLELVGRAAAGAVKGPPGLPLEAVPAWAELEAVQVGRDLRELTVWSGEGAAPGLRRAVLLPASTTIDSKMDEEDELAAGIGRYLFDPESCVTRAGLVGQLAAVLGARQIDRRVAYLTGDAPAVHPLCASLEVLEVVDFGVRRLRDLLRVRRWRPEVIRRRAFPVEPGELRRMLGAVEGEPVTLVCLTAGGRRTVVVARAVGLEQGERG